MIRKSRTAALGIAVVLCLAGINPGAADVLLVPEVHETIAAALEVASHGDTVSLAVGSYFEHDLVLPPGVSLLGRGGGPEDVIVDAMGEGRVIWGESLDESNILQGFTIRGGYRYSGGGCGAYLIGHVTLRDLIVEDNSGVGGSGIGIKSIYPLLIEDCVFRNNRASSEASFGGGLSVSAQYLVNCTLRRLVFIGNEAWHGAALFMGATHEITVQSVRVFSSHFGRSAVEIAGGENPSSPTFILDGAVIAHNSGFGIHVSASGTIRNCTILDCGGGIIVWGGSSGGAYVHIDNSLVAFNEAGPGEGGVVSMYGEYSGYSFLSCSDVFGNLPVNYAGMLDPTGTDGNISEDPIFCDFAGPEDYPIRSDSPCASANNSCGVLMGAYGVGCGVTATEPTSWSRIKSLY